MYLRLLLSLSNIQNFGHDLKDTEMASEMVISLDAC